jgi:SNF2 family DNA or RNA helicase
MEMKVFCPLTREQASLYAAVVEEAGKTLDEASGIRRKGVVLATLSKLKQVCNHPAQFLGDNSSIPGRSGKLARLVEMLEEVLAEGGRALVFTQFAEMGELLRRHLQETYGREVLFLHGGTPQKQRDALVAPFQEKDGPPVFVLSLKAGGTGLNLTAANHVFHFDRWRPPAVENQATDRAFRIGQTRNVQVHRFLCVGTVEERIDEMIERKQEVASRIVGSGEGWLTELSTAELKDLMALRREALGELARCGTVASGISRSPGRGRPGAASRPSASAAASAKVGGRGAGSPCWRVSASAPAWAAAARTPAAARCCPSTWTRGR